LILWNPPAQFRSFLCHHVPANHLRTIKMSTGTSSSCKVILAGTIAKGLLNEIQSGLKSIDRKPHLLGILGNDDPAAKVYADWTQKTSEDK